ncbi:unnamed protein product, partial [Bubo scandiacus]
MRTLVPLWLTLAGAGAWLRCPEGQPCPATPVLPASSAALCQDGSSCPARASCPLPEGVPCADGHHCCPRGSRCSADSKSCIESPSPRAVPCPDGQSECPDNATCCVTASGTWGCCPMPQASCCADKVHCCPHATVCDLTHGRCLSPTGDVPLGTTFPAWKRQPPAPVALHQVLCPDGRSACPDGATCCQLPSAQYGCCPLQNGTACDLERSTCTSSQGWARPLASLPKAGGGDVRCDEETSCPDGNTCCRLSSGAWGCCPLEQAVCCPDHVHCCPQGYTCDPEGGSCLQEGGGPPALGRLLPGPPALLPPGLHLQRGHPELREAAGTHPPAAGTHLPAPGTLTPPPDTHPPTRPAASCQHPAGCRRALRRCPLLPWRAEVLPGPGGLLGVLPLHPGLLLLRRPSLLPGGVPLHWGGAGGAAPSAGTCLHPAGCCSDVPGDPPGCHHPNKRFLGQTPSPGSSGGGGGGGGAGKLSPALAGPSSSSPR